jgi:hypothetical protein
MQDPEFKPQYCPPRKKKRKKMKDRAVKQVLSRGGTSRRRQGINKG